MGTERATAATGVGRTRGAIRIDDVEVRFGAPKAELVALRALDLAVGGGQIVSVIGPNGCGKSTMLRVIAGLIAPTRGAVLIDGEPIAGPDPRIGLVFQEPRLLPWRTVARNVAYPAELAGITGPELRERTMAQIRRVGLVDAADLRPAELSGGMRQRAALARALVLEPDVLLLDEPFSALDAMTRDRFNVELLGMWAGLGTTIVVVTHSIPEAIFLADRVIVLSGRPGHVVADVAVDLPRPRGIELLDHPAVAALARVVRGHLSEAPA
ncbi:MAG: ABC transporter ATP-binding protein [Chloroflexi bacterium]|nr:ABC transporter ATP-binding protein [Chloroflexota bacterium]